MTNEKGFSLVELIIVVALLGVLAAVAAPNYINYLYTSRIAADISTARSLAQSAYMYCGTHGVTSLHDDFGASQLDVYNAPESGADKYSYRYDDENHTVVVSFVANTEKAGKYAGYYEVTAYGSVPHAVTGGMTQPDGEN